jgi:TetR/AcrR family transcriptional repressor of nem operon
MQFQIDLFHKWAAKKGLTTSQQLAGYFTEMSQIFVKSGYQRACLTGKFSTEVAATSELFRQQLGGQLQAWTSSLVELLRHGQENGDVRGDRTAEELADAALALIQGAFVIALATRDKHTLAAIATTITHLIEPTATTRRKRPHRRPD